MCCCVTELFNDWLQQGESSVTPTDALGNANGMDSTNCLDDVSCAEQLENAVVSKQDIIFACNNHFLYCVQPSLNKVYKMRVTDGERNRHAKPTHYFRNVYRRYKADLYGILCIECNLNFG